MFFVCYCYSLWIRISLNGWCERVLIWSFELFMTSSCACLYVCVRQHLNELKRKWPEVVIFEYFGLIVMMSVPLTIDSCDAVYTFISIFLCYFFYGNKGHLNYLLLQTMDSKRITKKMEGQRWSNLVSSLVKDAIQILQLTLVDFILFAHALRFWPIFFKIKL